MNLKSFSSVVVITILIMSIFSPIALAYSVRVNFVAPTADNASTITENYTSINVTVDSSISQNNTTAFIDWNDSLLGWWRFDRDNETFVEDCSSYQKNGTMYNMDSGLNNGTSGWTTEGKFGNAMMFDGLDDRVEIPDNSTYDIPIQSDGKITMEAWVYPLNLTYESGIISKRSNYRMIIRPGGELKFQTFGWTGGYSASIVKENEWSYIALTYDGEIDQLKFYLNGNNVRTVNSYLPNGGTNGDALLIGRGHDLTMPTFNGTIDEVRLWKRVLNPEEIRASYNAGLYHLETNFTGLEDSTYTYTAYAQDIEGNVNQTETRMITVNTTSLVSDAKPAASFSADVTSGSIPLVVNFTDQSTNTPTSWFWDFGDDNTSTDQNPTHTYTIPDNYTVSLRVENAVGSNTSSLVDYIRVSSASLPLNGDGTESNPYKIYTLNDLQNMNNNLSAHYILMNDIDASETSMWNNGAGFEPIPYSFTGTFDGQNHTISNLYINRPNTYYVGLFGYITGTHPDDGTVNVKCLNLEDVYIVGYHYAGGLIGRTNYGGVYQCTVSGHVEGLDDVGGLIGYAKGAYIAESSSTGTVESEAYYAGGLVGEVNYNSEIINSDSSVSVTSAGDAGGLVGCAQESTIENSYSCGPVSDGYYTGGLIGYSWGCSITSTYWDTETSGQSSSYGGIGKKTAEMKTQSTFIDWDFDNVWAIESSLNDGYPTLRTFIDYNLSSGSPFILFNTPSDDTKSNETINISGTVSALIVSNITINHNGNISFVPVENGSFTATINLSTVNNITASGADVTGSIYSATLLLDGDMLPESYEYMLGFDPLNPDSNSTLSSENLAGNGIPDGLEVLNRANGDMLPAIVKSLINGNQTKVDSNDNGLTDYFEFTELHIMNVSNTSSWAMSLPDEDPDNDNLTNIEEQNNGTFPLNPDTDGDNLKDGYEVNISHTDPLSWDSDGDGLSDATELKLGTDPNDPTTYDDNISDGSRTFTTTASNSTVGVNVSINGVGDMSEQVKITRENSSYYTNISSIVSQLVDISVNDSFNYAEISIEYGPEKVANASNLSLCYFNETYGLYVPVPSTVDAANHSVSANVSHLSTWAVFDTSELVALYQAISDYNQEVYYGNPLGIPDPGDSLIVPYDSNVTITFLSSNSGYNDRFGLSSPTSIFLGYGYSTASGTVFDLGNYTNGTELILYLTNQPGQTFYSGPASRNPDNVAHAYVKSMSGDTWNVGWEDLYGGGDRDYNDIIYNITFTNTMIDSDEDGLFDYVETHGIMDNFGHVYYTDPYNPDTDGDGLTDGEEVGVLQTEANSYINYSYNVISDPTSIDTDDDGLTDYEEVHGSSIYVADSYESAVNFMYALYAGTDPTQYLTAIHVTSDPRNAHSDSDGINDYEEIAMGTNPGNPDTDGDHIRDNLESLYGEDPTIFDITPPVITSRDVVRKDSFSATTEYYFLYGANDRAGVKELSLFKNDILKDSYSYSLGNYDVSEDTYFETNWETFLDALRGSQVTIEGGDWNDNSGVIMAYHRPSQYGMWAAQLGSDTLLNAKIANDLGMLSGSSIVLAETPSTAVELCNDPVGYLGEMKNLASTIYSDPVLLGRIVTSFPEVIKEQQELENPYDEDNPLHDDFADGWYSGYITMSLATAYMGNEVTKSIKTSEQFAQATSGLANRMEEVSALLKNVASLRKARIVYFLMDETASLGGEGADLTEIISKMGLTDVKSVRLVDDLERIGSARIVSVNDKEKLCTFIARTSDDGVSFVNSIDESKINKLFSISSDKLDSELMDSMSANLAKLNKADTPVPIDKIEDFIDDIDELKNVNGVDKLASRVAAGNDGTFKGAAFEAEFAVSGNVDDIVEMGATTPKSVSTPGDIDLIRAEGSQNVAYELKNVDFANMDSDTWLMYQKKLGNQNTGLKNIVDNEIPVNGKVINNYKFMFREQPPTYVTDWLNEKTIPYDVFL